MMTPVLTPREIWALPALTRVWEMARNCHWRLKARASNQSSEQMTAGHAPPIRNLEKADERQFPDKADWNKPWPTMRRRRKPKPNRLAQIPAACGGRRSALLAGYAAGLQDYLSLAGAGRTA
jgi:hypothetical protein